MDSDRLFLLHTRQMKAQTIVQLVPNRPSLLLLACMFDKVAAKSDALAKEEVTEDQANRDMARIQYLHRNGFNCFAASLNCPGAEAVAGRHVDTDFGNRRFVGCVMKRFREHLPFTQIALDHVWCKNAHSEERWSPNFYKVTLPKLRECLPMPGPDEEWVGGARPGAIYIPCCIAAFVNVYAYREHLLPFYAIEYLTHDELKRECMLYRATEGIDLPKFGKEKDQARLYAFTEKQLAQYEPPPNVTPAEVMAYAQKVDPTNKPMICLSRVSATEGALHPVACDAKHFEQRCGRCADCMAALDPCRLEERIARRSSTCAGIGDGLFVTADIDEGDPIVEYTGSIVTRRSTPRRSQYAAHLSGNRYVLAREDSLCGAANHACGPAANCRLVNLTVEAGGGEEEEEVGRIFIVAERAIRSGEECFFDYGDRFSFLPPGCKCSTCRSSR